jgi:molecular chaperone DnaJ
MSEDFYEVLGVSRDADEEEIKQAYRTKATEYHPDVSDDPDAEEKFKKIKKAKEVLTDEEQRRQYDQMGHDQFEEAQKRGGVGGGAGQGNPFGGMGGNGAGFGGFEDLFNEVFGGGGRGGRGRQGNRPRQGQDLRTRLTIDLDDAYEGIEKQVTIRRPEICPDCDGEGHPPDADVDTCPECDGQGQVTRVQQTPFGRMQQTSTCRRCGGDGQLADETCATCDGAGITREEVTLTVEVPAGIRDGQTLRMEREGAPGENGGPKGDLLIEVSVDNDTDFERDGDDLYVQYPISFPQAVFGDTVQIETLGGTVEMDVPEGTQSGEQFRLKNKGMPRLRGRGHGDLYVAVQIVTPSSLNGEQKEALKEFAEAGGEEVDVKEGFFEKIKNSF